MATVAPEKSAVLQVDEVDSSGSIASATADAGIGGRDHGSAGTPSSPASQPEVTGANAAGKAEGDLVSNSSPPGARKRRTTRPRPRPSTPPAEEAKASADGPKAESKRPSHTQRSIEALRKLLLKLLDDS